MKGICTLALDINTCKYFNNETGVCELGENKCGFYKDAEEQKKMQGTLKKVKWFEIYLK